MRKINDHHRHHHDHSFQCIPWFVSHMKSAAKNRKKLTVKCTSDIHMEGEWDARPQRRGWGGGLEICHVLANSLFLNNRSVVYFCL